jgi:ubiquinone biosynthesis protein
VVQELGQAVMAELNFLAEAENIETFTRNFKGHHNIKIPGVIKKYTTRQVLVMECVEGVKISDLEALQKGKFNRKQIAENLVDILYHQIYIHGFFHADPHPGNLAIARTEYNRL